LFTSQRFGGNKVPLSPLSTLSSQLSQCVHCGKCKSRCPTFRVEQREWASARGKLSLSDAFVKGEIDVSPKFIKAISECLTCGQCKVSCPNDIDIPSIIQSARIEIVKEKGLPFPLSFLLRNILNQKPMTPYLVKVASLVQGVFFKKVADTGGGCRRLPLPYIDEKRLVPSLAKRTFLEKWGQPPNSERSVPTSPRVALFSGCLINYAMPAIGEATLKALGACGAEVIVPEKQGCCGLPALNAGDIETAKSQAIKVLNVFGDLDVDFITASCATCSSALKEYLKKLVHEEGEEIRLKAEALSYKVRDITELLVRELRVESVEWSTRKKKHLDSQFSTHNASVVTYHDPCHLSRYQGIKDEPRALIEASGAAFREMAHPCSCCGLGGSFNLKHYDFSMEINRHKTEHIVDSGADVVATACPGCILQLKDGLHRRGVKKKVIHVVELLADRLQKKTKKS
jgi:glycolate oxidase iron-sulfur subunit